MSGDCLLGGSLGMDIECASWFTACASLDGVNTELCDHKSLAAASVTLAVA